MFLVGGGNSLPKDRLAEIPPDSIMALNSSAFHFSRCKSIMFMDYDWFRINRHRVYTMTTKHKFFVQKMYPEKFQGVTWVKRLGNNCNYEHLPQEDIAVAGTNVGCCAINFLDQLRVEEIYLLGFDCNIINGKSHSHEEYTFKMNRNMYETSFIPCFYKLSKNLKHSKVFNCSTNSNLTMFPHLSLDGALLRLNR